MIIAFLCSHESPFGSTMVPSFSMRTSAFLLASFFALAFSSCWSDQAWMDWLQAWTRSVKSTRQAGAPFGRSSTPALESERGRGLVLEGESDGRCVELFLEMRREWR